MCLLFANFLIEVQYVPYWVDNLGTSTNDGVWCCGSVRMIMIQILRSKNIQNQDPGLKWAKKTWKIVRVSYITVFKKKLTFSR